MSLYNRRKKAPITDQRTVDNPENPKHSHLNAPRGSALDDKYDITTVKKTEDEMVLKIKPKQRLAGARDYSKRETARPFGDQYSDISEMISTEQAEPGLGLVKVDNKLAVDANLSHVTTVGTLTKLNVSGSSVFTGTVSIPEATADHHAATRAYVKTMETVAGTGINKTRECDIFRSNGDNSISNQIVC
jgi:hypothetical protein